MARQIKVTPLSRGDVNKSDHSDPNSSIYTQSRLKSDLDEESKKDESVVNVRKTLLSLTIGDNIKPS